MKLSTVASDAMLDALKNLSNGGGTLKIYDGGVPTDPDAALSGNNLLATFTFAATAFGTDSTVGNFRQASATFANGTVVAAGTGNAAFARMFKSDGTPVADLSVGTSGQDVNLNSVAIAINGNVTITSFLEKMPVH